MSAVPLLAALLLWAGLGCAARLPEAVDPLAADAAPAGPPRAPRAVLEQHAASLDATVRGLALAALIQAEATADGGPWAARATWDPSPWVQRAAAEALAARLPAPGARDALASLAARPGLDPHTRCLVALHLPRDAAAPLARRALDEASGRPVQACLLLLAEAGDDAAAAALLDGLRRGRLRLDLDLAAALAASPLPALGPALAAGVPALDESARALAGVVLLAHGEPQGRRVLADAALRGERGAGLEVVDLVLPLAHPDAAGLLEQVAGANDAAVARYARLAMLAHGRADAALVREVADGADPDELARALRCAADALEGDPGDPRLRRLAQRLLDGAARWDRPQVVEAAALLSSRLGDPAATQRLEAWLADPDAPGRAQVAVARALLGLRPPPR